jgi:hypothetical protein
MNTSRLSGYLLLACCLLTQAAEGQDKTNACDHLPVSAAADVTLKLTLKGGQSVYHEGEIIPLDLAFAASSEKKYSLDTRTSDHSGRFFFDSFCLAPDGRDPLGDYFGSGIWLGFAAGGPGSTCTLGHVPCVVTVELNEWKSLAPGDYTLRVVSGRSHGSLAVVSNAAAFKVVAATPEWQAEQLAYALSLLDAKHSKLTQKDFEQMQHAVRIVRFLGSPAATRELARRFWAYGRQSGVPQGGAPGPHPEDDVWRFLLDRNYWDFKFGLIGSPHREVAIKELAKAIDDPQHPATREMVETLALLQVQSNPEYPRLLPYDSGNRDGWEKHQRAKKAAYDNAVDGLWARVGAKR